MDDLNVVRIPTYVINLSVRTDRKAHILAEFDGRIEFDLQVVEAISHEIGAIGHWSTITHIIKNLVDRDVEYILICEDDHQFTDDYSLETMFQSLSDSNNLEADILLGGASSVNSLFKVSRSLVWVEGFTGAQFMFIFKRFFANILDAKFARFDTADFKISSLSTRQFLIFPFISIQAEFGYSDLTPSNSESGYLSSLFIEASNAIKYVLDGENFYQSISHLNVQVEDYLDVRIPTYYINVSDKFKDRLPLYDQFKYRSEFHVNYCSSLKPSNSQIDIWESIKSIIEKGIDNEDDIIILCQADHVFTKCYTKESLIRNIIEAHQQGADLLAGAVAGHFRHALPVGEGRFWINEVRGAPFFIVFRKFFPRIIKASFPGDIEATYFLSSLTSNKMVLYPFISGSLNGSLDDSAPLPDPACSEIPAQFQHHSERLLKTEQAYHMYKYE